MRMTYISLYRRYVFPDKILFSFVHSHQLSMHYSINRRSFGRQAPPTEQGTEAVTSPVAFIQETVFGRLTTMTSERMDHCDTAYSSAALAPHTDTTYYSVPAGWVECAGVAWCGMGSFCRLTDCVCSLVCVVTGYCSVFPVV